MVCTSKVLYRIVSDSLMTDSSFFSVSSRCRKTTQIWSQEAMLCAPGVQHTRFSSLLLRVQTSLWLPDSSMPVHCQSTCQQHDPELVESSNSCSAKASASQTRLYTPAHCDNTALRLEVQNVWLMMVTISFQLEHGRAITAHPPYCSTFAAGC